MIISHIIILEMKNVSDSFCRSHKTLILGSVTFFSKIRDIYKTVRKHRIEPDKSQSQHNTAHVLSMLDN